MIHIFISKSRNIAASLSEEMQSFFVDWSTNCSPCNEVLTGCCDCFLFSNCIHWTAIPKSLLRRPSKKVETYVQGCVPIYLNTILSYASFISDSGHLTCSLIQTHTACPTARSPKTCYSPGLNMHVIQNHHNHASITPVWFPSPAL